MECFEVLLLLVRDALHRVKAGNIPDTLAIAYSLPHSGCRLTMMGGHSPFSTSEEGLVADSIYRTCSSRRPPQPLRKRT